MSSRAPRAASIPCLVLLLAGASGCSKVHRADFKPLDDLGMSYSSEETLRTLDPSDAEILELAKVTRAGVSDSGCIELMRIARSRKEPFADGDAIAGLRQAGMAEAAILELDRLNQLGLAAGEEQAMRLAGLSDKVILGLARRHAAGQPALSGASLAELKNAGVGEAAMLELLARGVGDDRVNSIVTLKNRRASDAEILARFPAH